MHLVWQHRSFQETSVDGIWWGIGPWHTSWPEGSALGGPRNTQQDSSKHTEHEPGRTGEKNAEQRPQVGLGPDHQRSNEAQRPADTTHEPPSLPAGAHRCPTLWIMGTQGIPPAQGADGG